MANRFFKKHAALVTLILIFILGMFIRLWGTLHGSFAYTYDVGRDLLRVQDIVINHKLTLLGPTTGIHGLFYGPWWYYFLSIPFLIFNGNPMGIAASIGIASGIAIIGGYIFGFLFLDKTMGLILAGLFAFSPAVVAYSTQIWNPDLVQIFLLLWLIAFYFFLQKNRAAALFLGMFSGLVFESQAAFGMFFVSAATIAIILVFRHNLTLKKVALYMFGVLLIFLPRTVFDVRHDFLQTRNLIFSLGNTSLPSTDFLTRFYERSKAFFGMWNLTLANGNQLLGGPLLIFTILSLAVFYKKCSNKERRFVKFFLLIILFILLFFSLYSGDFWHYYLVGLPVLYIVLFVFSLRLAFVTINKKVVGITIILYMLFLIQPLKLWQSVKNPYWEGDAAVYRNAESTVREIYQDANDRPFNYIVYTPPVIPYTYEYLFLYFSGKQNYSLPPKENKRFLYVIIEPENERPELQKEWLKLHENDGVILWEKQMKGGVVLQKREREGM